MSNLNVKRFYKRVTFIQIVSPSNVEGHFLLILQKKKNLGPTLDFEILLAVFILLTTQLVLLSSKCLRFD